MDSSDLKAVAELFEKAGANGAEDTEGYWEKRFKEFVDTTMAEHASSMKLMGASEKQEVMRTRQKLYGIVEERINSRVKDLDPGLAEVANQLSSAQTSIFSQVLAEAGKAVPRGMSTLTDISEGGSDDGGPSSPGIAAFAAARKNVTTPVGSAAGGYGKQKKGEMDSNWQAYQDALSDSGSTKTKEQSPQNRSSNMIWGTTNSSGMRGGPAALGAGPQDTSLQKPAALAVSNTYSGLHQKSQSTKGGAIPGLSTNGPGKDLTLRMLRDIIHSVYASKAQHDLKCQQEKETTETMEQHLYSYLGKRYGLKSVIQEWASSIFRAIKKIAPRENDVAVFGKILQNTLAESFPSVQDQLRQTVQNFLRSNLEERHARRPQAEIEALWRARSRCGIPLTECEEVVKYMYNDSDSEEIMQRLAYASQNASDRSEPLSPDSVSMKDTMQVLLFFQMGLTEAFLSDFVEIFRKVDTSGDGVLSYQNLEELIRQVGYVEPFQQNIDEEFSTVEDPVLAEAKTTAHTAIRRFRKGATFSQCVELLTGLISARWGAITPQ